MNNSYEMAKNFKEGACSRILFKDCIWHEQPQSFIDGWSWMHNNMASLDNAINAYLEKNGLEKIAKIVVPEEELGQKNSEN